MNDETEFKINEKILMIGKKLDVISDNWEDDKTNTYWENKFNRYYLAWITLISFRKNIAEKEMKERFGIMN